MDTAVSLVQAYLHVNGYFTVVEHPVLESPRAGHVRTVTDLDVLAYRLPGTGHDLIHRRSGAGPQRLSSDVDPALGAPTGRADMIVGEVKEGRARLNPALRDPATLEVALARFGCCPAEEARDVSRRLLDHGRAATRGGHEIRVVAFGGTPGQVEPHNPWTTVPMNHVVKYLQAYLHAHWHVLRHAQIHDEGLAVLALMEKWGLGHDAADRLPVP